MGMYNFLMSCGHQAKREVADPAKYYNIDREYYNKKGLCDKCWDRLKTDKEEVKMHKELKKEIINWLIENEDRWQRLNSCTKEFRNYIYDDEGSFLIGGEDVSDFISKADNLIYK